MVAGVGADGDGDCATPVVGVVDGDGADALTHVVRVVGDPPPRVSDPAGQTRHRAAFDALYLLSTPHGVHGVNPTSLYVPAMHWEQYASAEAVALLTPSPAAQDVTVTFEQLALLVPLLYVLPTTQLAHTASSADGDPVVYPIPAPHGGVE